MPKKRIHEWMERIRAKLFPIHTWLEIKLIQSNTDSQRTMVFHTLS